MSVKPVITTAQEYDKLLPARGFDVEAGRVAARAWGKLQGVLSSNSAPRNEPKKMSAAEDLAVKLDAYITQAGILEIMGESAPVADYEVARDAFYEAFRVRVKECDCKVSTEEVLVQMLSSRVETASAPYEATVQRDIINRLTKEALSASVIDAAKRCAAQLFALSSEEASSVDRKVGLVSFEKAEKKIIEECRNFMHQIAALSHLPSEETEDELHFSDDETTESKSEERDARIKAAKEAKKQRVDLPKEEKEAIDRRFRAELKKCIQEQITALRTQQRDTKALKERPQAVYAELMEEGKKLTEEIARAEKIRDDLNIKIGFLKKGIGDLRTPAADVNKQKEELRQKQIDLRKVQEEIVNKYGRCVVIARLTDPKTRQPGLEKTAQEKAEAAIKIWEEIESRLNGELFPAAGSGVVSSVATFVRDVFRAPEKVEAFVSELKDHAVAGANEVIGTASEQLAFIETERDRLSQRVSLGYKGTKEYVKQERDRSLRAIDTCLRWTAWSVFGGVTGQVASGALSVAAPLAKAVPVVGGLVGFGLDTTAAVCSFVSQCGYLVPSAGVATIANIGAAYILPTTVMWLVPTVMQELAGINQCFV